MSDIYDILLNTPLFQGLSRDQLQESIASVPLHFAKHKAGETIVAANDRCENLTIILTGEVTTTQTNTRHNYIVTQTLDAPTALYPLHLFGRDTTYPVTVTAIDTVGTLQIHKNDFLKILASDNIFAYNYLNYLAMNAQRRSYDIETLLTGNITQRLALWINLISSPNARDIVIIIQPRDLCKLIDPMSETFDDTIDDLQQRGLIRYTHNTLHILDRRTLTQSIL